MTGKLVLTARQHSILDHVNQVGSAQIKDLAVTLGVSEATARRDFDEMAAFGLVERVHGGIVKSNGTAFERFHSEKMQSMLKEKQRLLSLKMVTAFFWTQVQPPFSLPKTLQT